jgi:lipopolysaccharide cholinephosphotransferase
MNNVNEETELRKAQKRMLSILVFIDKICIENNIDYWLDSGTLLGAVRHEGFIPWDDDSDICMTRKSYKKFKKIIKKYPSDYILQNHATDKNYFLFTSILRDTKSEYILNLKEHNIRKYRGLQTDIFILEDRIVPLFDKISFKLTKVTGKLLNKSTGWMSIFIARFFFYLRLWLLHPIFRLFKVFMKDKDVLSFVYGGHMKSKRYKSEIYPIKRMKFEGIEFNVPCFYEKYLRRLYGDYMVIPKEEDRVTHNVQFKFY